MGRTGSLGPNIHYRKAAARERQQLARSGWRKGDEFIYYLATYSVIDK